MNGVDNFKAFNLNVGDALDLNSNPLFYVVMWSTLAAKYGKIFWKLKIHRLVKLYHQNDVN